MCGCRTAWPPAWWCRLRPPKRELYGMVSGYVAARYRTGHGVPRHGASTSMQRQAGSSPHGAGTRDRGGCWRKEPGCSAADRRELEAIQEVASAASSDSGKGLQLGRDAGRRRASQDGSVHRIHAHAGTSGGDLRAARHPLCGLQRRALAGGKGRRHRPISR